MRASVFFREMWYPVPAGDLVRVGSDAICDIRIPYDPYVSRRHCSLAYVDGVLTVADLSSSHGTYVNGELLEGDPCILQHGDRVRIGSTELVVHLGESEPGADSHV